MTERSRAIAELSPTEKRALLARILQDKARPPLPEQFAISVTDLKTEAILEPTIRPKSGTRALATDPARILLTGATGFLGTFLLSDLLRQTTADIYCLVRAANAEAGRQRLHQTLASYGLDDPKHHTRIIPIIGNLSEPLLGLSTADFHQLAQTVDAIYHNGAFVNWIYPYARLKPPNVLGTQEVLRFACEGGVKPVHYVSTLAVFPVLANAEVTVIGEQDTLDHGGMLYGGYTQSKWVAEKLVTHARERGVPVTIYRPSMITGQSETGVWRTDDVLCRIIKSTIELGSTPEVEPTVNMVPVDYVSKAIVALSRQPAALGQVFHIAHAQAVYWQDLFTWIRTFGYPVQSLPYDAWRDALLQNGRLQDDTATYYLMPLFSLGLSQDGDGLVRRIPDFDCRFTFERLAGTSITCPPVDRHMFRTYFDYFIRCGFLDAPPTGNPPPCSSRSTRATHTTEVSR